MRKETHLTYPPIQKECKSPINKFLHTIVVHWSNYTELLESFYFFHWAIFSTELSLWVKNNRIFNPFKINVYSFKDPFIPSILNYPNHEKPDHLPNFFLTWNKYWHPYEIHTDIQANHNKLTKYYMSYYIKKKSFRNYITSHS